MERINKERGRGVDLNEEQGGGVREVREGDIFRLVEMCFYFSLFPDLVLP